MKIVKLIGINLLILFLLILIIEFFFGSWFFKKNSLDHLSIPYDRQDHYSVSDLYDDSTGIIKYSRDDYGLRGKSSFNLPSKIDILTIGGSTTDQRYISDGQTWQDVLENKLKSNGINMNVSNAGIDGQSTYGHIKNFELWFPNIPNLTPKFVIYYIGINDFFKEDGDEYDNLLNDESAFDIMRSIRTHSAIWHLARKIYGTYIAMMVKKAMHRSIDFKEVIWTQKQLQDNYDFFLPHLQKYADRIRILVDNTVKFGAKPIFVSQPFRKYRMTSEGIEGNREIEYYEERQINGVDNFFMMQLLNEVTNNIAFEKNAFYVNLAGYTYWEDDDFYDYYHMSPKGADKLGKLLHYEIKDILETNKSQGK